MSDRWTLGTLQDTAAVAARAESAGLTPHAARAKAELFAAAAGALRRRGCDADAEAIAMFVPGRIEVLGKHTDYCGGRSLLADANRGFAYVALAGQGADVRVVAADRDEEISFRLDPELAVKTGHWANYPMTVARRIARNFAAPLRGAEIAFASDLPPASGMSSSSAMIVGAFGVFDAVNGLADRPAYRENIRSAEDRAGYLGTVENGQTFGTLAGDRGVGTFGGSEDHTAMLCCKPDTLSQYAFCPVVRQREIAMPEEFIFAVASSGVVAEKTGDAKEKYNRMSALNSAVADAWRAATGRDDPHVAAAVGGSPEAADRMRRVLRSAGGGQFSADELIDRFEHFYAESEEIIPAAGDALGAGDIGQFARQVDRSQELTETLLRNQVPETIFLARTARELGADAASAFGAGFGGSVWSMVRRDGAEDFLARWQSAYQREHPEPAETAAFFTTRPAPAAFRL